MAVSCLHSHSRNESCFLSYKTSQFSKPLFINPSLKKPRSLISFCLKQSDLDDKKIQQDSSREEDKEEEEDYWVVTAVRSRYNEIVIVDTAASRYLLLDSTKNVHSVINKGGQNWTGSYWDESATLPPIIPNGPIAIYGLGGGTSARLMLELWPSMQLDGWEIDEIMIQKDMLVSWKRTPDSQGLNFVALTGGLPDLSDWSNNVPVRLSETVKQWKLCENP
ncbi:hypothetical protein EUTSA_v10001195mg [Eutrema salsugineum]|uniref:PABS domain-containing protein n=1 Tax=Eutrema salsugineum TaxID=72664 RepID=V4KNT7_EUTSA|nr:hypothetical protein EUTSA_v10001195mg [Eutrema salsugineum]